MNTAFQPRLLPPVGLLLALVAQAALHFVLPLVHWLPWPARLLGLLPAIAGVAVVLHAARAFDIARTTILPGQVSSVLVTSGFYRYTRNPMYLGMVALLFGVALLSGALTTFLPVGVFALWIDRRFIANEERMMRERFGAAYVAYCERVRRWL